MRSERSADWLTIGDATERIVQAVPRLGTETIALLDALGRTLREDVLARHDQPPWDNSAMDGYAVRSRDVRGASADNPRTLVVIESVPAGRFATRPLGAGEAIEIMTGAPVPEGTDGVVRVEHTRRAGDGRIEVLDDSDADRNVRARGEDVRAGETVLAQGSVLREGEVGVLATVGRGRVQVAQRPRVAILSTGNELVDVDEFDQVLAGRRIVNSNSYALAAATQAVGGTPALLGIAKDEDADIRARIERALTADALVTSAGASVGEHDIVKDALESMGMRSVFWRVKIRPGSPFSFGVVQRAGQAPLPVFGLPGNPVSAVVTFEILVKPALRAMMGRAAIHPRTVTVRVGETIESRSGLVRFLRVQLRKREGGLHATLTGNQGSGVLTSVARADALLVVPIDVDSLEPGESAVAVPLTALDDAQPEPGF